MGGEGGHGPSSFSEQSINQAPTEHTQWDLYTWGRRRDPHLAVTKDTQQIKHQSLTVLLGDPQTCPRPPSPSRDWPCSPMSRREGTCPPLPHPHRDQGRMWAGV